MITHQPRLSVIIPCRNEALHIVNCLRSLLAQYPVEGGFEIIVADGQSDDGTRELLDRLAQEDPRIQVVDNPQRITPCALNHAIRAAKGSLIARVDAHTEYSQDYLASCLRALKSSGADNVGGPHRAVGHSALHRAIAAAFNSSFVIGGSLSHNLTYEGEVDSVHPGCWRREVFDRVGLFDEELVRNQDDEHNYRLRKAGGRVWQSPNIRYTYSPRSTLPGLWKQYFQYGYWKVRVMQKHRMPTSLRSLVPAGFLIALALCCLLGIWMPMGWWLGGALAVLYIALVIGVSALLAGKEGWNLFPLLMAVIPCYQLSYGLGYLSGLWDFVVMRKQGRHTSLSR